MRSTKRTSYTDETEKWKFIDQIHLSDCDLRRLKLAFNTDWDYNPEEWSSPVLGSEYVEIQLFAQYTQGEKDFVLKSIKTHDPSHKKYHNGEIVFSFIPYVSEKDWVLVAAFKVVDEDKPLIDVDERDLEIYRPLFGRLIVHFEHKSRGVVFKDRKIIDGITVTEILSQPCYELNLAFPGYRNVSLDYRDLKYKLDNSKEWQTALKCRKGVYVISDKATGRQYVGSAYGKQGIYGRWRTYIDSGFDRNKIENGNYPNKEFQQLVRSKNRKYIEENFHYALLETFADDVSDEFIIEREQYWKDVLLTKKFGYNAN